MATGYGIVPRDISSNVDPFKAAVDFTEQSNSFVQAQIFGITTLADETYSLASGAISALEAIGEAIALPEYDVSSPLLNPNVDVDFDLPPIDPAFWGTIDDFNVGNTVDTSGIPTIGTVTVPGFDPTEFTITQYTAPPDALIPEPGDVPQEPTLVFPEKIVITLPDSPTLAPITIPMAPVITIPDFNPEFPEFSERTIQTMIDWQEPVYTEEVIDEVKLQLSTFFAGGSGIDPDIEDSIFARGRDREDRVVNQAIQQATAEWANKGFTAPPGMLAKRLDNIREEGTLKKLGLNREAMIKVHQDEIDNLRFAVQQGIAAEQLYVTMFLAKVERMFEIQKLNIEWQIQLYGLYIQVFGIRMEEVKVRAQVYQVQVQAALIEIEVFKALIDAEKVKADMNKVLIEAYTAEIGARVAMVEMYKTQVEAVGVEADVFATQVGAYKSEVDAYASRVEADKTRFEVYATKINAERLKVDILTAEARAYAAEVQGFETGVKAEVAGLEGVVSGIEAEIRNYEAIVRGQVGRGQVQLGQIQANVAGNNANTQRFVAKVGAEEAASKVDLAAWEGTNRTNLEIFKADVVSYQAKLERAVKEIELLISSQSSAGSMASTITAGALAAMHVGASLNSSSGVTASGSQSIGQSSSEAVSCSTNNSSSLTFASTGPISHDCPSFTS